MSIKLVLLKSGEEVIADTKEMVVGDEKNPNVVGYFLNTPCLVRLKTEELDASDDIPKSFKVGMYPWVALTKDKTIPVPADWIVTIVEPIDNVRKMYVEDVLKNDPDNQNSSSSQSGDPD